MKKTYKNKDSKKVQTRKNSVFTNIDYHSGDGMLTSVWGPSLWHFLHTMSFNYPVHPSDKDKEHYLNFMRSLQYVLPCKYCRTNLKRNYKELPISKGTMKDRDTFSKYVYDLHEHINKMLHKKSNLSYDDVRERYEHFRSRCLTDAVTSLEIKNNHNTRKQKNKIEKGCTKPLYGKKSKCILKIVPQEEKVSSFQIDKKCIKTRKMINK